MNTLEIMGPLKWSTYIGVSSRVLALVLLATVFLGTPTAVAAAPVISTSSKVEYGATSPSVTLVGVNFDAETDKFDFTVDLGTTGLRFDSVAFVNSTQVRIRLTGTALEGAITIQGNTSAFSPVASGASNTLIINVPAAPIFQSISFITPVDMSVNSSDQTLIANASSGLTVTFLSTTPTVCTVDLSKVHAVSAGTCSIKASHSGDETHAPAVDVVKKFTISATASVASNTPVATTSAATNLGAFQYFPDAPSGSYVDVLVAPNDAGQASPTLLKLIVPSRATAGPAVFLISAFSSDAETSQGYFVTRVSLVDKAGSAITYVAGAYEVKMPAGAKDAELYWSSDGFIWQKISESKTEFLPMDSHAIYFREKDGSLAILTDQLGLFGYRKAQAPFSINSSVATLNPSAQVTLSSSGGSGSGAVIFGTTTAAICALTTSGVLTGIKEGKCLVTARKYGSEKYIDTLSNRISIEVKNSNLPGKNPIVVTIAKSTCDPLSYSLSKSSTMIQADFCPQDAGKIAILYVRSNSSTRKWVDKKVASVAIDSTGRAVFKVSSAISKSNFLHVFVDGDHRL